MVEKANVFPPRSLPGIAENWGRHVEQRIELGERSEVQLAQKVDNGLRANEGVLTTLSSQVNELFARRTTTFSNQSAISDSKSFIGSGASPYLYLLGSSLITLDAPRQALLHGTTSGDFSAWGEGYSFFRFALEAVYFTSGTPSAGSAQQPSVVSKAPYVSWFPEFFAEGGGHASQVQGLADRTTLRLTPGTYLVGYILLVNQMVNGGNGAGFDMAVPEGAAISTLDLGPPDPSITTSDIPQYTP